MNIAILGAHGQLGGELCREFGKSAIPLTRHDCDLLDPAAVARALREADVAAVVNAAAYTAVDKAEEEQELCFQVNAKAVQTLADVCSSLNCHLLQISSDYVFGGDESKRTPFTEEDETAPQGVYARSKLAGEDFAAQWEKSTIVRTCGLYSLAPQGPVRGRNFVDTMLVLGRNRDQLKIVDDQHCTPTSAADLATAVKQLIADQAFGLFHVTNLGETTWFGFASEVFRRARMEVELIPITTEEFGAPAPRPRYSVLNTRKFHELASGILPTWQQAVGNYVSNAMQLVG